MIRLKKFLSFISVFIYCALFFGIQASVFFAVSYMNFLKAVQVDPALGFAEYTVAFTSKYAAELLVVSSVVTLLVLYIISLFRKERFGTYIYWGKKLPVKMLPTLAELGIGANFWIAYVISSVDFGAEHSQYYADASASLENASNIFVYIAAVAILAPIVEEILFRGIILKRSMSLLPPLTAVFFQAVIFGLMHSGLIWFLYAAFMGIILGYTRMCLSSLASSMAVHILFSASSVLLGVFEALLIAAGLSSFYILPTGLFLTVDALIRIAKFEKMNDK